MHTITKHKLQITDEQTLQLTQNCEILAVQGQGGVLQVWVEQVTTNAAKPVTFYIYGTGADLGGTSGLVFLSTVQMSGFTWHIFTK